MAHSLIVNRRCCLTVSVPFYVTFLPLIIWVWSGQMLTSSNAA